MGDITPTPTDEEAAAIAAALMVTMTAADQSGETPAPTSDRWRFSGRWWNRGHQLKRRRP